jgi:hypothetical protein
MEEIEMKKILACFFALFVINNVYSLGLAEADTRNIDALFNTDSVKAAEGLSEGYKLFIDVISEMQIENDKNFDMEYIINTYVSNSEFDNKTNYDWIKYLTGDIAAVKMKMTVFMNLLEIYVEKQKEIVYFNKNFYNGIMLLLDEYKNKGYKIQQEEIKDLNIQGFRIPFWGDEYKVTAENYTIYFYYDRMDSKNTSTPLKKIIIDKKSGTTYFDKYIGSTRKMILSLRSEKQHPNDDDEILTYYNNDNYVLFYFDNDIVKKIEYGDNFR